MMFGKFIEKKFALLANSIFKYAKWYFVGCLILTGISVYFVKYLRLDANFNSLISQKHPTIINLNKVSKIYGGIGSLIMVVEGANFDKTKNFVEKLVPNLLKHKDIRYIDYKTPINFFDKNALLYADVQDLNRVHYRLKRKFEYERKKKNPLFSGMGFDEEVSDPGLSFDDIINKYKKKFKVSDKQKSIKNPYYYKKKKGDSINSSKHTFIVLIKPSKDATNIKFAKYIIKEVDDIASKIKTKDVSYRFTGRYQKQIDSLAALSKDFKLVSLISLIGVLLILVLFFRNFWFIILIFIALLTGIIWTFAVTYFIFGTLNIITSFLSAILFGLGIDFGIHFLVRYREERQNKKSVEESFKLMITETGVASLISSATTAFVFFILYISGFKAFQEFGVIAGFGVLLIFLAMTIFLSSFLLLIEKFRPIKNNKKVFSLKLPKVLYKRPSFLIVFLIMLFAIAAWNTKNVKFDYAFSKILEYNDLDSYKLDKEVNKQFGRSLTPAVILPNSLKHEKQILKSLNDYTSKHKNDKNNRIDYAVGLSFFLPTNQNYKLRKIKKIKRLLIKNKKYFPLMSARQRKGYQKLLRMTKTRGVKIEDLPSVVKNNFSGKNKLERHFVILLFPKADLSNGKEVLQFSNQISNIKVAGQQIKVASSSLIFAEILKLIQGDGYFILILCITGVFLLTVLNFRSISKSLLIVIPLIVGLILLSGYMGLFSIPLDFFNVILFPIIIGIGIDSGVHIYHRYQETNDILFSIQNTGEAVAVSSLTTMVGFGALGFAINDGVSGMGYVAVIGIMSTLFVYIILLPAIILLLEKYKQKK